MKIFKHNLAYSNRHGLSVIEVLTSIVVALIGVFGVLAMIPFSVKQTQSGLDQDAATSMARNALSNFEATGFKVVSEVVPGSKQLNWVVDPAGTRVTTNSAIPLLCIDPLGVTEDGFGTFPFNCFLPDGSALPPQLMMPSINLVRADGIQFGVADARRMFRLTDDLVFEESNDPTDQDADINGPVQIFNESPTGGFLNRQSTGAVSWCAVAQPIVNDPNAVEVDSFKFNVLVFKDRVTDSTAPESAMAAAVVTLPVGPAEPLSSVTIGVPLDSSIRRNDWVMLINLDPAVSGTDPIARRTNMAFARVSNLYSEDPEAPGYDPDNTTSTLTLDGPDFDFTNGPTYIVHLRDVVAVFPRTIKLETLSGWNVND